MPRKRIVSAETSYQKLIEEYKKALSCFQKGDFKKAEEILEKIKETETPEKEIKRKACVYLDIIKRKKEKPYTPKEPEDFLLYGIYLMNIEDYDEAEKFLKEASKKIKTDKPYYYLSCLYALRGEKDAMIKNLKRAIELNPAIKFQAKINPDFSEYYDDEDFMEVTKNED